MRVSGKQVKSHCWVRVSGKQVALWTESKWQTSHIVEWEKVIVEWEKAVKELYFEFHLFKQVLHQMSPALNKSSVKLVQHQTSPALNKSNIEQVSHWTSLMSNGFCIKWVLLQMSIASNESYIKWVLHQMSLALNESCIEWVLNQTSHASNKSHIKQVDCGVIAIVICLDWDKVAKELYYRVIAIGKRAVQKDRSCNMPQYHAVFHKSMQPYCSRSL